MLNLSSQLESTHKPAVEVTAAVHAGMLVVSGAAAGTN